MGRHRKGTNKNIPTSTPSKDVVSQSLPTKATSVTFQSVDSSSVKAKRKNAIYHSFLPTTHPVSYPSNLDDIYFQTVTNDASNSSSIKLIALKNIFSRQLPKMPKEYIVRLVFDHRHISLAIMRQDRIIGGVCYRPYYEQRFAEIAFLAINSNEQVKGYGSILMNQLKHHVQKERIEYFLTYADNFAIGYFQKQGFSKQVMMPKERWMGFIKDYDGGTLMECYIHPGMDYLNVSAIVAAQRRFIADRIKELQRSDVVHSGLDVLLAQGGGRFSSLLEVPGVAAAGWTASHLFRGSTDRDRHSAQNKLTGFLKALVDKVRGFREASLFMQPLPQSELQHSQPLAALGDYADMNLSLSLIMSRVRSGDYYKCKEALHSDLHRMTGIWLLCGTSDSPESRAVDSMTQQIDDLFRDMQLKDFSVMS